MIRKIKVTISKEDVYDVNDLIDEIKDDPKSAFELCKIYGYEDLTLGAFADFDSLNQKDKDRLVEDYATSKSESDAALSGRQEDKFDTFFGSFDEEN
jgi:hypothetical protein